MSLITLLGIQIRKPSLPFLLFMGCMCGFSFAPFYLFPLLGFGFCVLSHARFEDLKSALLSGFIFGMGLYGVSLCWIIHPFAVVGLAPFGYPAVLGMACIVACFCALSTGGSFLCAPKTPFYRLIFIILFWSFGEWVRGWIFTGFPWNYTLHSIPFTPYLQCVSVLGVDGASLLTTFLLSFLFVKKYRIHAFACCLMVSFMGYVSMPEKAPLRDQNVRIVQPNIPQNLKWHPAQIRQTIEKLEILSMYTKDMPIHLLVWSESAVNLYMNEYPELLERLRHVLGPHQLLITGTIRREQNKIFNTLVVFDAQGHITHTYDKSHLAPFGEYIPLRSFFPWLGKLTPGAVDYTAGREGCVLDLPLMGRLIPQICYEGIFPVNTAHAQTSSMIVNITNDAWFGKHIGPYQHLQILRIRAIEAGLPIIRSANTGISCVIDPYGRLLAQVPLNETGFLDASIPCAKNKTIFDGFKQTLAISLWLIIFILTYLRNDIYVSPIKRFRTSPYVF